MHSSPKRSAAHRPARTQPRPCFFTEDDYLGYLHWLRGALTATRTALHAYVLMTNHAHLLLPPPDTQAVPQLIISLGRRYVPYINRTHRRAGTLWDSRYKSSSIQASYWVIRVFMR